MVVLAGSEVVLRVSGARTEKLRQLQRRLTGESLHPAIFLRIVNYACWKETVSLDMEWQGFVVRAADLLDVSSEEEGVRKVEEVRRKSREDPWSRVVGPM